METNIFNALNCCLQYRKWEWNGNDDEDDSADVNVGIRLDHYKCRIVIWKYIMWNNGTDVGMKCLQFSNVEMH